MNFIFSMLIQHDFQMPRAVKNASATTVKSVAPAASAESNKTSGKTEKSSGKAEKTVEKKPEKVVEKTSEKTTGKSSEKIVEKSAKKEKAPKKKNVDLNQLINDDFLSDLVTSFSQKFKISEKEDMVPFLSGYLRKNVTVVKRETNMTGQRLFAKETRGVIRDKVKAEVVKEMKKKGEEPKQADYMKAENKKVKDMWTALSESEKEDWNRKASEYVEPEPELCQYVFPAGNKQEGSGCKTRAKPDGFCGRHNAEKLEAARIAKEKKAAEKAVAASAEKKVVVAKKKVLEVESESESEKSEKEAEKSEDSETPVPVKKTPAKSVPAAKPAVEKSKAPAKPTVEKKAPAATASESADESEEVPAAKSIQIERNQALQQFVIKGTQYIVDPRTKAVTGKIADGKKAKLTDEDKTKCKKLGYTVA